MGQRVRLTETGNYQNKSFTYDALLLFREGAVYEINEKARTCKKSPLTAAFHPMEIPKNASLLGQAVVGSSSIPGEGLLVNTWIGDLPGNTAKYITTFTKSECIPVSTAYQTKDFGWMLTNFFNNVIGISDPNQLNPPDYCPTEMSEEQPGVFASLFFNLH
ncbi:ependymin-like [Archocentrus centrarchus]|uniref:ependymin-like n=1 Tax=Archocentrus centrarchus TaxID=63155 RepID=UPI0011EA4698|nr:ependymin-like [Archocentrus centrarchus]